jgi:transcriptional regulator with XRE-family HTH domain
VKHRGRTTAFRRALRLARPTLQEIANGMGMHINSVSGYLNRVPPSDRATRLLARWLKRHAQKLEDAAYKLERGLS